MTDPIAKRPAAQTAYALTLKGDERHIAAPGRYQFGLPADALGLCGKLIRYQLRSQPWTEQIPICDLCSARSADL